MIKKSGVVRTLLTHMGEMSLICFKFKSVLNLLVLVTFSTSVTSHIVTPASEMYENLYGQEDL